ATLAQQYSEDSSTASSGGDLGLIPQSVLMTQTPAALREAILRLQPGQVSQPISTPNGYYLLKLVGIEPAGLRPLSDPQVRQSIRDLLSSARQRLLQAAFLATVRNQAKVVNYLAQQILEQK
ncbi:MAG: peptidylprolyl isomerase, partial [Terriglobales bacterium]